MAIANALQLEADRATPALSHFNYKLQRHAKFEVAEPIHCRISVFAADTLLYTMTLTFDTVALTGKVLEHLQCITCDTMKHRTKFDCNRTVCGGVIANSIFDLMTLSTM